VIPEAPFLFSIAGLSATVAGLAGLVVGLRRGTDLRPLDRYRLREIVEFCFANVVLAVGLVPLSVISGSVPAAVRVASGVALVYIVLTVAFLIRRSRIDGIPWTAGWVAFVSVVNIGMFGLGVLALVTGSIGWYEALLVFLLSRPMFAFLLVIDPANESRP
jgi:hypothetical protein